MWFQTQFTCGFNWPGTIDWSGGASSANAIAAILNKMFLDAGVQAGITVDNHFPDYAVVAIGFTPGSCSVDWNGLAGQYRIILANTVDYNGNRIFNSVSDGAVAPPFECLGETNPILQDLFGQPKTQSKQTKNVSNTTLDKTLNAVVQSGQTFIDNDPSSPTYGQSCKVNADGTWTCTDSFGADLTGTPTPQKQTLTDQLKGEAATLGVSVGVLLGLGLLAFAMLNKD